MVQLFFDGGNFMWPILIIFIIGLVFVIERLMHLIKGMKLDETFAQGLADQLKDGNFTMDNYLTQLKQMKKMGGLEGVMSLLPGANKIKKQMENSSIEESMLIENEAIILSMTKKERLDPKIISGSRKKRLMQL